MYLRYSLTTYTLLRAMPRIVHLIASFIKFDLVSSKLLELSVEWCATLWINRRVSATRDSGILPAELCPE